MVLSPWWRLAARFSRSGWAEREKMVAVDCLKPYLGVTVPDVAVLPKRGRPPWRPCPVPASTRRWLELAVGSHNSPAAIPAAGRGRCSGYCTEWPGGEIRQSG
jgi:hypothetical protein